MKRILFVGMIVCLCLLFPLTVSADDLMAQADALFNKKGMANYKKSVDLYLKILESNPDNYEANWKCARAFRFYGNEAKVRKVDGWKRLCAEYGKKGMTYAQKAIDLDPGRPDAYYFYGLSVGVFADGVSVITALREGSKEKTQSSFEKVYEINKMYNNAGIMISLGRFWQVLPWPFRDTKKALTYYREYKNTKYFGTVPEGPIYMAELLIDMGGKERKAEARTILESYKTDNKYWEEYIKNLLGKVK